MPHTTPDANHHDFTRVVDALREALDRRGLAILSGPCASCMTWAWMSATHPVAAAGWSVWAIAPSSLKASVDYNGERGLDVDAFLEHVQPTVLVLNAAADEICTDVDLADTLKIQERFIRARLEVGLATLVLTHQRYPDLDPDLLEWSEVPEPFLVLPEHRPEACVR